MTLVAIDLNASRARAAQGMSPREMRPLPLADDQTDLPMAVSLEGRHPELGRPGLALVCRSPQLACVNFLPHLGSRQEWSGPRQRLDAARALSLVFDRVATHLDRHNAAALALPGYIQPAQRDLACKLAAQSRIKLHGTVDAALAAALAAHAELAWTGAALVLDVDEHALTLTSVSVSDGEAHLLGIEPYPHLGLRIWRDKLLDAIAHRVILQSKRDPRDVPDADQALFEQSDGVLEACQQARSAEVVISVAQWYQTVTLNVADVVAACAAPRDKALRSFDSLWRSLGTTDAPATVILTDAAARLPGLVWALEHAVWEAAAPAAPGDPEDFGEHLLADETAGSLVRVLPTGAICHAVAELASRFQRQVLVPGHLERAPLLDAQPPALGEPRLQFRGREHPLGENVFELGRDPRCQMVFETTEFPSVSGHHCEIVSRPDGVVLIDRSRHGTFVNDSPVEGQAALHPGDWIRLGPSGPLVRFLGQWRDRRKRMTIA